ncbi:hypothetical protein M9458_055335 [Cirrhinus mrigala]|uniref:Uncharacterized protein n=1 Tax=Cirrhinus mrigala TaxID=683832 RepID=A0ABD0MGX0_CIRMR
MSQARSLWLLPSRASGNPLPSFDYVSHNPAPGAGLFRFRVPRFTSALAAISACLAGAFVAKFCWSCLSVIYRTAYSVVNRTVTPLSEPLLPAFRRPSLPPPPDYRF